MELTHTTDLILLHRWRASRDAEAFRALAERYAGLVFAAAHRVLGDPSEAEDVAQECFLTLAQARKPPKRNLGAWLHTAAVNRAKNHIRGEVRRRQREQHYDALQPDRIQIELDDTLTHVDEAIAALDDELRHVIIAHFLEAKSQGEIADTTGVSRQTVNARAKRGIEAIREHLTAKGITATTASLTALLGSQMVEAAPAPLVAALGKLALSGGAAANLVAAITIKKMLLWGSAAVLAVILSMKLITPAVQLHVAPLPERETVSLAEPPVTGVELPSTVEPVANVGETMETENPAEPHRAPLENGRYLTGIVVDENGQPVAHRAAVGAVHVQARLANYSASNSAQPDSTFDFRDIDLPGRSGVIAAWIPDLNLVSDPIPFTWTPGQKSELKLVVREGTRLEGTAVFADSSPIADAEVEIRIDKRIPFSSRVVRTDTQGAFSASGLGDGEYKLTAQVADGSGGQFPGANSVVYVRRGQPQAQVTLQSNCMVATIAGRVTDEAGIPIAGAQISSYLENYAAASGFQAKSGPDGLYQLSVFSPGESIVQLSIESKYVQQQKVNSNTGEVNFVVGPPRSELRIQAVNASNGEPVTKYIIRYREVGSKKNVFTRTVEDSMGNFTTGYGTGGAPVNLTITVLAQGLGMAEKAVRYDPDHVETHIMVITAGESWRGRVRHADGHPAEGVSILPPDLDDNLMQDLALAVTDASGAFELAGIPSGVESLVLLTETGLSSEESLDKDTTWDFVLPEPGELSGQILSETGDPLKGCGLSLLTHPVVSWPQYGMWLRTSSDEQGKFTFTGLGEATGTLFVNVPDGPSQEVEVKIRPGKVTTHNIEFSLPRARFIGSVSVGGAPVGTGTVRFRQRSDKGNNEREASIRTDGIFEIENLPSGESDLEVRVHLPRERKRTEKLPLKIGDNAARFDFVPGDAALSGSVPLMAGRTLRSLKVRVEVTTPLGVDEFEYAHAPEETDAFLIDGLSAGDAHVKCTATYGTTGNESGDSGHFVLTSEFAVTLQPGEVAELPVLSGMCPVTLEVTHTGPAYLYVMIFDNSVSLPDFDQMSMNDFEVFQREHPPILADGRKSVGNTLMGDWPQLMPGAYTLVVLGPGASPQSEDEVMEGMRYEVLPVTLEAGKPTALKVDLK